MPIFQYNGYDSAGTTASGTIEAETEREATHKIRSLGIFPKDISVYTGRRVGFKRPNKDLIPSITRQLSILLSSGVPLVEALKSLSEEHKGYWRVTPIAIAERISAGASLSRALEDFPEVFPEFYRNMVASGEASGTLDNVLSSLADYLESEEATKEKVKTAMMYPAIMVSVGFLVLAFLFTYVIPKIVKIFEDSKSALPLPTKILIAATNMVASYWYIIIALMFAAFYFGRKWIAENRVRFDGHLLKLPGGVLQSLYLSRFTRTFGFLLQGGIPVLRALELSGKATGNLFIEKSVRTAGEKVAQGARLSSALEGFPPTLIQLISTGEKGGRLVEVMQKAASSYEDGFDRKVQKALKLLEPAMILVMAAVVLFIVVSVLLPMIQMNKLIK